MSIAVIGGSGFRDWDGIQSGETLSIRTPYDPAPVQARTGRLAGRDVVFIPRHGADHGIPPHRINYRANIWALKELDVNAVIAMATVGGISTAAAPGRLLVPDQILDYTYGRAHTYFDGGEEGVGHIDMTEPYWDVLRMELLEAARDAGLTVIESGTYAATQGPRFETAAEIRKLERDGADVVGMTGMPEAALARELRLAYAAVAVIINPAAGKADGALDPAQISQWLQTGRQRVEKLIACAVARIGDRRFEIPPPLMP